ncbi:MAG: YncE family protein [Actinomycetota bacterium]|nr:YncE family protein [Actinomycetota bacterium]
MGTNRLAAALSLALFVAVLAGCGEGDADGGDGFASAAEPAEAPPLETEPVGELLPVGSGAEGLAVDGETGIAALGVREPPSLELIDLEAFEIARTIELSSHPRHLQLAEAGGPVLVPAEDSDELIRVELPSGAAGAVSVGDFPHDAAALGDRVFVGNEFGDTISVLEGSETVETLDAPVQPGGVVASGGLIGVIAVSERVLTVFDPDSLAELGTIDAGEGPTHIVAAGRRAFVADTEGDSILEFRLAPKPRLVGETALEGTPYGIAIDPARERLWVTLTARNEVVELAFGEAGLDEVARYPTVEQPNTIGIDPRTGAAIVAGATEEAILQRIEPSGD